MSSSYFYRPKPTEWGLLPFSGADAGNFLHRLTSLNVSDLKDGEGGAGTFLNPQGKIVSAFFLFKEQQDQFYFELAPGANRKFTEKLAHTIDFFTFGEKIELSCQSDLKCLWFFSNLTSQNIPLIKKSTNLLDVDHGSHFFGKNWKTVWGNDDSLNALISQSQEVTHSEVESWRIQSLTPWWDHEIKIDSNPLEVGFHFAISANKGCYPGQEVIEKILSLGSPAKRLVSIEIEEPLDFKGSMQIHSENSVIGDLTTYFGGKGLGVIRKTHAVPETRLQIQSVTSIVKEVKEYLQ